MSGKTNVRARWWSRIALTAVAVAVVCAAVYAVANPGTVTGWLRALAGLSAEEKAADHHDEPRTDLIELSPQARENIGLELEKVALQPFETSIRVPAMIVEVPGRSHLRVPAPLTGIVTRIYPVRGQWVVPGQPLFDIRLTHEELVQAQADYLRVAAQLNVARREVARLEKINADGGLGGQRLLDHSYEKEKLAAELGARGEGLALHGLTEEQVRQIKTSGRLLQGLTVNVPGPAGAVKIEGVQSRYQVEGLPVELGQHVTVGDPLAVLSNYDQLYIEGTAFEQDARHLVRAQENDWNLTAVLQSNGRATEKIEHLKILYVANAVEQDTRALHFYLRLPNEPVERTGGKSADAAVGAEPKFITWKYRPGQRVQLAVPTDVWQEQIVLPVDAVVEDGAERFVYRQVGNVFRRQPVHVVYRDRRQAVIAKDGSLTIGEKVAGRGAYLIHLAIKNKAGGGGPAGHGHSH